jgi:MFS family permease
MNRVPQNARATALFGSAWSLFAALALLLVGNGLLGSLLGIRAEIEGFATTTTGIVLAFYYLGFLVGTQYAPIAVTRVGHIRVFAGLTSLASVSGLLHAVSINPIAWIVFRTIIGACLAGLYVVAESWLNAGATNETRGRLLSLYMVVVMGGIGVGQLLLGVADPAGFGLFILAASLMSLAVLPISLSASPAPNYDLPPRMQFGELWKLSPVGLAGSFGAGLANGAIFAMGPVYGIASGMSVTRVSLLMGVLVFGAVVLQWPIGSWSDRVPRRRAIVAVNLVAAIAALAMTQADPVSNWLFVAIFVLGGSTFPIYSLSLSHLNDVLEPRQVVAASSIFVLLWGIGSTVGPIAASVLMTILDPTGLYWMMAATHLVMAGFVAIRVAVREGPPVAEQEHYVPIPARASALVGVLSRVRRNPRKNAGNGNSLKP